MYTSALAAPKPDPFELSRFVLAQDQNNGQALLEIQSGQKESCWMWYIFPQVDGLGTSETSEYYAIKSKDEAAAYLEHKILGPRLRTHCAALLSLRGKTADEIFGYPDDLKLKSSMTLFAQVTPSPSIFTQVLEQYFDGDLDPLTLERLDSVK
jgi:uncharacterized protein (DUF1810 family)